VLNLAGAPIELFWINTFEAGRPLVLQTQTPIRNGTDTTINSYDTHQFLVKFKTDIQGVSAQYTKGPRDEVITVYYTRDAGMSVVQTTKLDDIKGQIKSVAATCTASAAEFSDCVSAGLLEDFAKLADEKSTIVKYRDLLSERLRNYTCADMMLDTTPAINTQSVRVFGTQYKVNQYLDMPNAKIWTVSDFVTPDECNILMTTGKPLLRRATVAADDGTSVVSENRKANQAVYTFKRPETTDPLWPLYTRVFKTVNTYVPGFSLQPAGQEGFTIIQYDVDDQYV
jgi:hypothetical protein